VPSTILRFSRLFLSSKNIKLSPERRSVLLCILEIIAGEFLNARTAQKIKEIGSDRKTLKKISEVDMRMTLWDFVNSQIQDQK